MHPVLVHHLTFAPFQHKGRGNWAGLSSHARSIELNIAGHVPGASRVCGVALFYWGGSFGERFWGQPSK